MDSSKDDNFAALFKFIGNLVTPDAGLSHDRNPNDIVITFKIHALTVYFFNYVNFVFGRSKRSYQGLGVQYPL
jgi:hypothetical protein